MESRYNKLLSVFTCTGEIWGRKRLQKIIYILQSKKAPFKESFTYHFYGPYSSELQLEIDHLVDKEVLLEEVPSSDTVYKYKIKNQEKIFDESLASYKNLIISLKKENTNVLELTSTIYYLLDSGIDDKKILEKKLSALKPALSTYIPDAFKLFDEIEATY